ncbi:Rap30/74 interaction domain-containing protein [Coprinopsis marcescibilis]|uniref:Rap30/74 interaction domain-containing protein n=1 Tax=Coprinopsis marcescibilis TaxID=230819 RepID=A0A5C3L7L4_COPMA|nr:Rap30/74 interaction domain-containing protein [Coprinopsis marcescibilis]
MAPQSLSLLFHPKKNQKKGPIPPPKPRAKPADVAAPASPAPRPQEADEDRFQLPDSGYSEFQVLSSSLKGWKYDVMKFDARKPVEILKWTAPVKLNRKDLRREDRAAAAAVVPQAVSPMLGPDGKPVIGSDGKVVMIDAEGKPIHNTGDSGQGANGKDKGKGKKRFQKKTRQVFKVPDEVRQLQREERYPWVLEDSSPYHKEHWIGQLEDTKKAETFGFFMPAANEAFKFVPAHRWYKFQKKVKHDLPTNTADVESEYTKSQKREYLAYLTTRAMLKEEEQKPEVGPGGRKLRTVVSGTSGGLFDDDDDPETKERLRKMDQEGDHDEQIFEEDFADDDEGMVVDDNDEDAKELEHIQERLKREYKQANKLRESGVDESEDEGTPQTDKATKKMQKIIRSREGNIAYESDGEENPYISEEEEEESEEEEVHTGPAIQIQPQQVDQKAATANKPSITVPTANSRATSPVASPSLGGHSLVAKRATSPKVPKPRLPGASSVPGSRATSPNPNSRATSPLANAPSPTSSKSGKRKAEDGAGGDVPKKKKTEKKERMTPAELQVMQQGTLAEQQALIINWFKKQAQPRTGDCINYFGPYIHIDAKTKETFTEMIKTLAYVRDRIMYLRSGIGAN